MSDGFAILDRLIGAASFRHRVISSNIANVDTPGYKAKDVKFEQVLGSEMKLTVTSPNHLGGNGAGSSGELTAEEAQAWADQNTVELDQEVSKMTENSMLYQAGVAMLATRIRMYKTAIKG
jgi:flagellar basal-body rod protein FlgB